MKTSFSNLWKNQVWELPADALPISFDGIVSPPPTIFGIGSREAIRSGVAIVGARKPGPSTRRVVYAAALGAKAAAVPVWSGLAEGTDRLAHEAALELGVPTIAVVSTHPLHPSPPKHISLAEKILEAGGAVISEQPQSIVDASREALLARNRIVVAGASLVVCAYANLYTGSYATIRTALKAHRRLVIPSGDAGSALECLRGDSVSAATQLKLAQDLVACTVVRTPAELTSEVQKHF